MSQVIHSNIPHSSAKPGVDEVQVDRSVEGGEKEG